MKLLPILAAVLFSLTLLASAQAASSINCTGDSNPILHDLGLTGREYPINCKASISAYDCLSLVYDNETGALLQENPQLKAVADLGVISTFHTDNSQIVGYWRSDTATIRPDINYTVVMQCKDSAGVSFSGNFSFVPQPPNGQFAFNALLWFKDNLAGFAVGFIIVLIFALLIGLAWRNIKA
jgi:hypothetical protein